MGLTRPNRSESALAALFALHRLKFTLDSSGGFSSAVLGAWPSCKRFYLVDIWRQQPNYKDIANVDNDAQDKLYNHAMKTLAPWK